MWRKYFYGNNNEIKKINNAHNKKIHIIKYYDYSLYDLILSTSCDDDIKIWNYNECLNILTISGVFNDTSYGVYSSCIILDKNISHILCVGENNYIKVYNSVGNLYKNIGKSDEIRRYIDSFEIKEKKYIVSGSNKGITVFNYPDLTEYHRFIENKDSNYHNYAKLIKIDDIYNLIDVGDFNIIKIWNFFNKTRDGSIKEFDIQKRILIKSFDKIHTDFTLGIKIIKDKNGKIFLASYDGNKKLLLWSLE